LDDILADEWITLGMVNTLYCYINVQVRPVEMIFGGEFDVKDLGYRGFLKPGELVKRHEKLLLLEKQPDAML
jgi:hypothetical protein